MTMKRAHVEMGFIGVTADPLVNDTVLGVYWMAGAAAKTQPEPQGITSRRWPQTAEVQDLPSLTVMVRLNFTVPPLLLSVMMYLAVAAITLGVPEIVPFFDKERANGQHAMGTEAGEGAGTRS